MRFSCHRCGERFATSSEPVAGCVYQVPCRCGHSTFVFSFDPFVADPPESTPPRLPLATERLTWIAIGPPVPPSVQDEPPCVESVEPPSGGSLHLAALAQRDPDAPSEEADDPPVPPAPVPFGAAAWRLITEGSSRGAVVALGLRAWLVARAHPRVTLAASTAAGALAAAATVAAVSAALAAGSAPARTAAASREPAPAALAVGAESGAPLMTVAAARALPPPTTIRAAASDTPRPRAAPRREGASAGAGDSAPLAAATLEAGSAAPAEAEAPAAAPVDESFDAVFDALLETPGPYGDGAESARAVADSAAVEVESDPGAASAGAASPAEPVAGPEPADAKEAIATPAATGAPSGGALEPAALEGGEVAARAPAVSEQGTPAD